MELRAATILIALLGIAFVAAAPFAPRPLGPFPAFIPAYEASLIICDLITAVLLIGPFAWVRSLALLVLGGGYLFDALMIVAHALSFPGLFAPHGLLGAGEQTTLWLYVFWHGGFPLFVLGYAALRKHEQDSRAPALSPRVAIPGVVGLTTLLATALGVLAFPGQDLLPIGIVGLDHTRLLWNGVSPAVWLLGIAGFAVQWRARRRSVLDLWLATVMWAWVMDVGLAIVIGGTRFDWGFYLSRSFGLLAATVVLAALLLEMNRLYASLAGALALAESRNVALARSREELARGQRLEAVGQLTGGVAHDFNNLLTVIRGSLEVMLARSDLPALARRMAERALQAAERGGRTVELLLTFARRRIGNPVVVDVNPMLAEFEPLLRQAAGGDVTLVVQLAADAMPVRIDAAQFEAAVLNLVVNARDAMPRGGRITVGTRTVWLPGGEIAGLQAGPYVLVTVADTGEGMPEDVVARVFEPFFTTKPEGKGSGLGLSRVYGFVTGSGGQIQIDSRVGEGTSINLYFPLCRAALEPAAANA